MASGVRYGEKESFPPMPYSLEQLKRRHDARRVKMTSQKKPLFRRIMDWFGFMFPEVPRWYWQCGPCGGHYWNTQEFKNGWAALVSDNAANAPRRPLRFNASATCRWWIVGSPISFDCLDEAKDAAVALALAQRTATADSSCRVAYNQVRRRPGGL